LWAPLRDFVDLRTLCFFDVVFFDLVAVERFAAISTISFGYRAPTESGLLHIGTPKKSKAARFQIRRSSWFPDAVLRPASPVSLNM
jgi:hypothetical protein